MPKHTFISVWDAIEETAAEAEQMKLRASLMQALEQHIRQQHWTATEAAQHLNVTLPRLSELLHGKIDRFSIEALINILAAAGLHLHVTVSA